MGPFFFKAEGCRLPVHREGEGGHCRRQVIAQEDLLCHLVGLRNDQGWHCKTNPKNQVFRDLLHHCLILKIRLCRHYFRLRYNNLVLKCLRWNHKKPISIVEGFQCFQSRSRRGLIQNWVQHRVHHRRDRV